MRRGFELLLIGAATLVVSSDRLFAIDVGMHAVFLQTTRWQPENPQPGVTYSLPVGTALPAERVEKGFLWLRSDGGAGWVAREKVVDMETGERTFTTWIERGVNLATAYRSRGNVRSAKGQHAAAVTDYTESIRLDPLDADTWAQRGKSHLLLEKLDEAIVDQTESLRLRVHHDGRLWELKRSGSFYDRGLAKFLQNRFTDAISDFDESIQLYPHQSLAYNRRGLSHASLGNHQLALPDFDKAIENSPSFAAPHNFRGQSLESLGRYAEAVTEYEKAVKLAPETVFVVNSPSHALYKTLDGGAPISTEDGRRLIPTFSPLNNLARLLVQCPDENIRNPQRASELVNILRAFDHGRYFEFVETEALVAAGLGDWRKAAELQRTAAQLAPPEKRHAMLRRAGQRAGN